MIVDPRGDELEARLAELDALCQTLSRDLRAPLRAIDGYSQLLIDDEGPRLSPVGRRHLDALRASAARMGSLVDGLLAYSRLANVVPTMGRIELDELARALVTRLAGLGALGRAQVDIAPLPAIVGDRKLLAQVLEQLLRNAAKFSSRVASPRIEIGCSGCRALEIHVKDNGAGFDMKHVHKLFGVYQRLHHPADFDGAGVGLAIARRIVERHGHGIRAESAPGHGATFSFGATAADAASSRA
jgi:light-regulated signal transduction histidine kinase (bacteriophytochrome)